MSLVVSCSRDKVRVISPGVGVKTSLTSLTTRKLPSEYRHRRMQLLLLVLAIKRDVIPVFVADSKRQVTTSQVMTSWQCHDMRHMTSTWAIRASRTSCWWLREAVLRGIDCSPVTAVPVAFITRLESLAPPRYAISPFTGYFACKHSKRRPRYAIPMSLKCSLSWYLCLLFATENQHLHLFLIIKSSVRHSVL